MILFLAAGIIFCPGARKNKGTILILILPPYFCERLGQKKSNVGHSRLCKRSSLFPVKHAHRNDTIIIQRIATELAQKHTEVYDNDEIDVYAMELEKTGNELL